ncbi:MAG: MMPL family transporter, partial [Planctomycetota bacterium]|nr:MMPL family transporter [Planctomycetota bacterium]
REALARRIGSLRSAEPATVEDLPSALRSQWVGREGRLLLRAYPVAGDTDDGSVLATERLAPFVEQVLAVAPNATGPVVQIYESSMLIRGAYAQAALFALAAIFVLLLIDFRSIGDVLCSMAPVVCGAALLLGVMGFAGIDLNFANTIVMPLIVGLGVDAGVHVVHRWRQQPHDPPAGLAGGTGRAVGLTTLTTVIGFACMVLGEHRGIRSLGLVMSLGLIFTWCATALLLPAILRLRTSRASIEAHAQRSRVEAPHDAWADRRRTAAHRRRSGERVG